MNKCRADRNARVLVCRGGMTYYPPTTPCQHVWSSGDGLLNLILIWMVVDFQHAESMTSTLVSETPTSLRLRQEVETCEADCEQISFFLSLVSSVFSKPIFTELTENTVRVDGLLFIKNGCARMLRSGAVSCVKVSSES